MEILRTPDERFADLAGFSIEPHCPDSVAGARHFLQKDAPEDIAQILLAWLAGG